MKLKNVVMGLMMLACATVQAESAWPSKPLRFIVPYAAGGATDVTARVLGEQLSKRLGQSIIVENRAGAGGIIGTDFVAKAQPDGYTMLLAYAGPININPLVYPKLPFEPKTDFTPVSSIAEAPMVLVVHPTVPVKSVNELITYAKANPEKLSYGTSGPGGADHLAGELFSQRTGAPIMHVPYKGGSQAMLDLVGGRIQVQFATIPGALPHIRSGNIIPLALISDKRFELLPDVPTIEEAGLSDFVINNWYGVMLPAGADPAVVKRLNGELTSVVQEPAVQKRLIELGLVPRWSTPAEFDAFVKRDADEWKKVVDITGTKVN